MTVLKIVFPYPLSSEVSEICAGVVSNILWLKGRRSGYIGRNGVITGPAARLCSSLKRALKY